MPSLDEVRAAPAAAVVGVAVSACAVGATLTADAPVCGDTRFDEVRAHAGAVQDELGRGALLASLREAGVALGWLSHGTRRTTTWPTTRIAAPGEAPIATPTPPPAPPPAREADGGIRHVDTTPAAPTPPPRAPAPPRHRVQPRGGAPAHSVNPRDFDGP